jgi:fused signal recognition particle receptor
VDPLAVGLFAVAAVAAAGAGAAVLLRCRHPGATESATTPSTGRVRQALAATRRRLGEQIDAALGRGPRLLDAVLAELEEALIAGDVGVRTAGLLTERVRAAVPAAADGTAIRDALRAELRTLLSAAEPPEQSGRPRVILVTGVNGVGKTTTIGKLAARYVGEGRRVLLVAADTFRAAAIEQLGVWAERSGADLVRHAAGASPAAVVFDGMKAALARGIDVVIVDTAGRLHTHENLMDELAKIRRVVTREVPGAPQEVLLVLDATTGQNGVSQARTFGQAVGVTGVAVTKLDGTARGGVVVAVRHELGLPIRYIGVGEGIGDLRPFDPDEFVAGLLDGENSGPGAS